MTGRSYDGVVNPPRVVPVETPWPPVGAELSALPSLDVTPVPPAYWFSLPVSTELSSALAATVHGPVRELGSPRMKREWRRRPGGAGADASEARPGLDDRLTWGWSRYRETGHHDRPAGALVDRDGRAGALWPDGRAQEPAGEDHHALALSGPPDDGQACGRGIANGRGARETLENSRGVPDSGEPILLVRDDPGGDRRGRADHRPDPHHEGVPSRSLTVTLRGFLAAGKPVNPRGAASAPHRLWRHLLPWPLLLTAP